MTGNRTSNFEHRASRVQPGRGRSCRAKTSPGAAVRPGFTLMELMVVLIILAVLASIALPRVTGSAKRSFETSVDQLSDLLMMYAQRDRLSERPVGIQYDPTRRWLMLVVMQTEDDNKGRWVIDRFVNPVKLPELIDADTLIFSADDEPLDIVNFPLTHQPGESRPTITVTVQSEERAFEAMLHLAPHDLAPRRIDGNDYYVARQGIDLDSVGRAREDW